MATQHAQDAKDTQDADDARHAKDTPEDAPDRGDGRPASSAEQGQHNPKLDANPGDNTVKNPDDWTTGGDPMTGAQASYLKTLSEQAHAPEAFEDDLSKAEASKRIDALKKNGSAA